MTWYEEKRASRAGVLDTDERRGGLMVETEYEGWSLDQRIGVSCSARVSVASRIEDTIHQMIVHRKGRQSGAMEQPRDGRHVRVVEGGEKGAMVMLTHRRRCYEIVRLFHWLILVR